jgi:hypothetical protein
MYHHDRGSSPPSDTWGFKSLGTQARDSVSVCEEGSTSARAPLDPAPGQVTVSQDADCSKRRRATLPQLDAAPRRISWPPGRYSQPNRGTRATQLGCSPRSHKCAPRRPRPTTYLGSRQARPGCRTRKTQGIRRTRAGKKPARMPPRRGQARKFPPRGESFLARGRDS